MSKKQFYTLPNDLPLESGSVLKTPTVAYNTYGTLNESKDNVVWIFHALTAASNVDEWWEGLVGKGKLFNPGDHYIVCANILGSCYGTTGPNSINPDTGKLYTKKEAETKSPYKLIIRKEGKYVQ